MNLAPIVLFVYNRPIHSRQTVESLKKNQYADQSDLIIYSDGPKEGDSDSQIRAVRDYIKSISGFKTLSIIEHRLNLGLGTSIIQGVTEVVNKYGKVIVLEDDLVTSPFFLRFMNEALLCYSNHKKVWHISGWNYPVDFEGAPASFLWRVMNCWGWATWANRWQYFEREPEKLVKTFSDEEIWRFNLDGSHDFWSQVQANANERIKTWAIFWYASIFKNDGLCLNPIQSLVENIGHDGSGTHCTAQRIAKRNAKALLGNAEIDFPKELIENKEMVKRVQDVMKKRSLIRSVSEFLCRSIWKK